MLSTPEYVEKNANVFLTLRNDVSNHVKTISDSILETIQDNWLFYNDTLRKMLHYFSIKF